MYDKLKALSHRDSKNWVIVKCMIEPDAYLNGSLLKSNTTSENIYSSNTLWGISNDKVFG